MRRATYPIIFVACLGWLASTACECGDAGLHDATPRLEHYFIGTSDSAPALEQYTALPEDDHILVDFGTVDVGQVTSRYLMFRNEGNGDMLMSGFVYHPDHDPDFVVGCKDSGVFVTDCGFSPESPLAVSPDDDAVIEIVFAPVEMGSASGGFTLTFNTTEHNTVVVDIVAQAVTPELQVCISDCEGAQLDPVCQAAAIVCDDDVGKDQLEVLFGEAGMDTEVARDVTVRNRGDRILQVSKISVVDPTHFGVDLSQSSLPGALNPGDAQTFRVLFHPDWGGDHSTYLLIDSNDYSEPQLEVMLKGRGIAPRVCPDPLAVDFGTVATGAPVVETVVLESCGLETLRIDNVQLSDGSSADYSLLGLPGFPQYIDPGNRLEVQVQYYPMSNGSDWGSMEIYSNDQSADETGYTGAVEITGRALDSACDIQVEPFAVNFGPTLVFEVGTVNLRITNVGNSSCTLESMEITTNSADDEYSLGTIPPGNTVFLPGDALFADVVYTPTNIGQDVGTLSLFGNDKDTDEIRVDLNGFGAPGGDGPIAVCSVRPTQASAFDTLVWDGSASYDNDANRRIVEYRWRLILRPPGSAATLQGSGAVQSTQTDLAGTYTAELIVVNDIGQQSMPCNATAQVTPSQDLWIEMYWTHSGDDMDLHMLAPNGLPRTRTDCYYANCVYTHPDWGVTGNTGDDPHLDLDDIPGTGPENINIASPANGTYTVFVNDYPGSSYTSSNIVYVNIYIDGAPVANYQKSISGENSDVYFCEIDWPSGNITDL
ncbi:MAG: choice-of-anchor D domain-containing protein [Deltaproteobacteria bacterium]|nr:choice-of-anchor D domain-containing protein [Deltaproteobacteria bacterium]